MKRPIAAAPAAPDAGRISQALERHSADRQHRHAYRSGDPRQALDARSSPPSGFDSVGQTVPATM